MPSSSSCAIIVGAADLEEIYRKAVEVMGPDKQIWRKLIEAVEVMGPDKMIAGGGSG